MVIHKGTVTLETNRLRLRRFELSDAEIMHKNWATDSEVTEYLLWYPHKDIKETKELVLNWVENYADDEFPDYYQWAIEFEGEAIGSISVFPSFENYEFGYAIGKKWWNRGIVTEASKAVFDYVFKDCYFPRLFSRHCRENPASGRVMQKLGMKREGILRKQAKLKDSRYDDIILYGILAEEWK